MLEWMGQIHVLRKFAFAYPTKVFWLGERLVERVGEMIRSNVKSGVRPLRYSSCGGYERVEGFRRQFMV